MGRFDQWRAAGRMYFEHVSDEQFIKDSQRAGIKFISSGSLRGKPGVKLKSKSRKIITVLGSTKRMPPGSVRLIDHNDGIYGSSKALAGSQIAQTAKRQGRRAAAERTLPRRNRTPERLR